MAEVIEEVRKTTSIVWYDIAVPIEYITFTVTITWDGWTINNETKKETINECIASKS